MATCPCDSKLPPVCLDIPPGLSRLPLQEFGFHEIKRALLDSVSQNPALKGWSTDGQQDLGVMILDMWAYVSDVTRFYDGEINGEFYLGTAQHTRSAKRLTKLLGYRPRPALSATTTLVLEADKREEIKIPVGTGFRSEGFDDEPPQVFETLTPFSISPARNVWNLRAIEDEIYPGRILLRARDNGVPRRGILAFRVDGVPSHASQISGVSKFVGPDDRVFTEVELEEEFEPIDGTPLNAIKARLMGLTAAKSPLDHNFTGTTLTLDGLYPQLKAGEIAVLETSTGLHPFEIAGVSRIDLALPIESEPAITAPVSRIAHAGFPLSVLEEHTDYRVHFNPIRIGRLRAPAKTEIILDDLAESVALKQPDIRLDQAETGPFVLAGQNPTGEIMQGDVLREVRRRNYNYIPNLGRPSFAAPLVAPLKLFGNVIEAVRGESIVGEVVGSADASNPNNRFVLKKAPLTWIEDSASFTGIRPLLDVYVDGIRWQRVESLYTAKPEDRVYRIEEDERGKTWIVFGNGKRGARPTSGIENVVADYRWGAGTAKPPPGSISQAIKPPKGLKRTSNPIPATGGADAEAIEDIRKNAPAKVLAFGRAVSVQDFQALAAGFPGVINTAAGWAWHNRRQRAVVTIWVISDGGLDFDALTEWLTGMAAEGTPVEVKLAEGIAKTLTASVLALPDHNSAAVKDAVKARLLDETLAFNAMPIGGVLYRSQLVKEIQTVPGVSSVPSLRVDGAELEWALKVSAGTYLDFQERVSVL
ncbi:MAG: baseplate J/gp47 family protein [Pseudomonadota bacterium]